MKKILVIILIGVFILFFRGCGNDNSITGQARAISVTPGNVFGYRLRTLEDTIAVVYDLHDVDSFKRTKKNANWSYEAIGTSGNFIITMSHRGIITRFVVNRNENGIFTLVTPFDKLQMQTSGGYSENISANLWMNGYLNRGR